jgi:hypothetical protein
LGPLDTAASNRPIVPSPGHYDGGEIGGMMIGRGNRSTRRKPASVPLCPPQIPHSYPDANPGRCGRKPATNRLSYGRPMWSVTFRSACSMFGRYPPNLLATGFLLGLLFYHEEVSYTFLQKSVQFYRNVHCVTAQKIDDIFMLQLCCALSIV